MALGVYITSIIVVILPAPLVYTATMFDALVEADKGTTACREYGCVINEGGGDSDPSYGGDV